MRNFFVGYAAYSKGIPMISSMSFQINDMPPRVWIEKKIKEQLPADFDRVAVISLTELSEKDYHTFNVDSIELGLN